jgi:WD40 repeat protein
LKVWEWRTRQEVFAEEVMPGGRVWKIAFSPDGKRLAAAIGPPDGVQVGAGEVRLWSTETWERIGTLKGHDSMVWNLAFSPDSRRLASVGGDHGSPARVPPEVKIWDLNTDQEVLALGGIAAPVFGVAYSSCGRRLATASLDGTVMIWDGTPLAETPKQHDRPADK